VSLHAYAGFEGKTLSGEPIDVAGNPLSPGDEWVGPHPSIPYVLTAGGNDIYYWSKPKPNVTKDSQVVEGGWVDTAKEVADKPLPWTMRRLANSGSILFAGHEHQSKSADDGEASFWMEGLAPFMTRLSPLSATAPDTD